MIRPTLILAILLAAPVNGQQPQRPEAPANQQQLQPPPVQQPAQETPAEEKSPDADARDQQNGPPAAPCPATDAALKDFLEQRYGVIQQPSWEHLRAYFDADDDNVITTAEIEAIAKSPNEEEKKTIDQLRPLMLNADTDKNGLTAKEWAGQRDQHVPLLTDATMTVVTYNHENPEDRKAYEWRRAPKLRKIGTSTALTTSSLRRLPDDEFDPSADPTVYVGNRQPLVILVEESVPAIYKPAPASITNEPIEDLANFQSLAAGLAKVLAKYLQFSPQIDPGIRQSWTIMRQPACDIPPSAPDELIEDRAGRAILQIMCTTARLEALARQRTWDLRFLDHNIRPPVTKNVTATVERYLQRLHQAFTALDQYRLEIIATMDPLKSPDGDVEKAKAKAKAKEGAGNAEEKKAAEEAAEKVTDKQGAEQPTDPAKTPKEETEQREKDNRAVLRDPRTAEEILARINEVIADQNKALTVAALLVRFERANTLPTSRCPSFVVAAENLRGITWSQTASHKFKVEAAPTGFGEIITTRPTPFEGTVEARSRTGNLLGIGAGITYTEITNPVWKAVAHPTDTTKKVIARTEEDRRSGQVALLAEYKFLRHLIPEARNSPFGLGLEFGPAIDTKDPAAFLGLSVDIGSFLRIGVGTTFQQVTRLSPGQRELAHLSNGEVDPDSLTIVENDAAIRTHEDFENGMYVSLSIALEGIGDLFKPAPAATPAAASAETKKTEEKKPTAADEDKANNQEKPKENPPGL